MSLDDELWERAIAHWKRKAAEREVDAHAASVSQSRRQRRRAQLGPDWFGIREAAERFGTTRRAARQWLRIDAALPRSRLERRWLGRDVEYRLRPAE